MSGFPWIAVSPSVPRFQTDHYSYCTAGTGVGFGAFPSSVYTFSTG